MQRFNVGDLVCSNASRTLYGADNRFAQVITKNDLLIILGTCAPDNVLPPRSGTLYVVYSPRLNFIGQVWLDIDSITPIKLICSAIAS